MNATAINVVFITTTILLLLIEWIARSRVARVLLAVGAAALILPSINDLGPSARRALVTKDRVTGRWDGVLPEYVSGVRTMKREAEGQTRELTWPVIVLVWLGVSPILPAIGRRSIRAT
jgi:hypothetical protein